jgi:hypothetical protein
MKKVKLIKECYYTILALLLRREGFSGRSVLLLKVEERLLFFFVPLWVGWDDDARRRALVSDGESLFAIVRLLLGGLSRFTMDTLPSVDGVCWEVLPQHINHFIILIYMFNYKRISEYIGIVSYILIYEY